MFCPQCGTTQGEEIRFCKQCGANMYAVRQVISTRETGSKIDWSKTWVAEMFLSQGERKRREQELEVQRGLTPEVKRYNEIKAGVITACIGIGLMILLYVLAQGIILGGSKTPDEAEIIRRIWVAGIIPFFVGMALLINGLFVSKKVVDLAKKERLETKLPQQPQPLTGNAERVRLPGANSSDFIPSNFSVTEESTRQLKG